MSTCSSASAVSSATQAADEHKARMLTVTGTGGTGAGFVALVVRRAAEEQPKPDTWRQRPAAGIRRRLG
jgi:hypothetical protein